MYDTFFIFFYIFFPSQHIDNGSLGKIEHTRLGILCTRLSASLQTMATYTLYMYVVLVRFKLISLHA